MIIQRPVRWLLDALGIITGGAPQHLITDLVPVIEVSQNGWAFAERLARVMIAGQVGVEVIMPIVAAGNDSLCHVVRLGIRNPGTATTYVIVRSYNAADGPLNVENPPLCVGSPTAGSTLGHHNLCGAPFLFLPPGMGLVAVLGPFTTTAGTLNAEVWSFPAGVSPF